MYSHESVALGVYCVTLFRTRDTELNALVITHFVVESNIS